MARYWSDESDLHPSTVPRPTQHGVRLPRLRFGALPRLRAGRARRDGTGPGRSARPRPLRAKASRLPGLRDGEGMDPWTCGLAPGPAQTGRRPVLRHPSVAADRDSPRVGMGIQPGTPGPDRTIRTGAATRRDSLARARPKDDRTGPPARMDAASQEPRRGDAGHRPYPRLYGPHLNQEYQVPRSGGSGVCLAGGEDASDLVAGGGPSVLRAERSSGAGACGFRCTGPPHRPGFGRPGHWRTRPRPPPGPAIRRPPAGVGLVDLPLTVQHRAAPPKHHARRSLSDGVGRRSLLMALADRRPVPARSGRGSRHGRSSRSPRRAGEDPPPTAAR